MATSNHDTTYPPVLLLDEQYARRLFCHSLYVDQEWPVTTTRHITHMFDACLTLGYDQLYVAGKPYKIHLIPVDTDEEIDNG